MEALLPYLFKTPVSNYLTSIRRHGGEDYNVRLRYVLLFNDSLPHSNSRLCNVEERLTRSVHCYYRALMHVQMQIGKQLRTLIECF